MEFNLEQAIGTWRTEMLAAGIKSPTPLDELENHLRDDVEQQIRSGIDAQKAFALAVSHLGSPATMRTEFNKVQPPSCAAVKIGSLVWIAAVVLLGMFLLTGLFVGRMNYFLFTHILTLTTGYGAALLTGVFGIYFVWSERAGTLSIALERELHRAVVRFTHLAAALVVAGVLSGLVWSLKNSGQMMGAERARAIGPICASIWFVALCLVQRSGLMRNRTTVLLSLGSNLLVGVAWFGVALLVGNSGRTGKEMGYWPLVAFMAVHLIFLALGMTYKSQSEKLN